MLWFERLYAWLRLPLWVGAIVIGFLPFLIMLIMGHIVAGLWSEFLSSGLAQFLPAFFLLSMFGQLGAPYICWSIEKLRKYSESMSQEKSRIELRSLCSFKGVLIVWALWLGPSLLQTTRFSVTFYQYVLNQLAILYWLFFIVTFLWTWGYSMFSIYRMGETSPKASPSPKIGL
jgi:hypothetical protein